MPAAPVRALQSVRERGLRATLRIAQRELPRELRRRHEALAERRFDRRLGVQTAGDEEHPDLGSRGTPWEDSRKYEPTPLPLLRKLLRSLPLDPARFTFVDVGSGKGRAPLLALEMGYRRAIGVELWDELHDTALANAESVARVRGVTDDTLAFVRADGARFELPPPPLVLFLYDPFGERTIRAVAKNLAAAHEQHPGDVYVVYYAPHYGAAFDELPWLERRAEGERWRSWGPSESQQAEGVGSGSRFRR